MLDLILYIALGVGLLWASWDQGDLKLPHRHNRKDDN